VSSSAITSGITISGFIISGKIMLQITEALLAEKLD